MELDHIALIISKEENLEFYRKLGFKEFKRVIREYDTVVFLSCGDVVLEVFVDPNHPQHNTNPETLGIRHLCFVVDNLSKVDVQCGEIRTDWFGRRYVFIKDPDGQPIELIETLRG